MSQAAAQTMPTPTPSSAISVSIQRSALIKALGRVQSVVERRGTIPILANVKLEAQGEALQLTTTDMDIAVTDKVAATVSEAGGITVPAQMLYDIVRKLPEGALELSKKADATKLSIRAGQSNFALSTLAVEDFPMLAEGELPHSFSLKTEDLKALFDKTRFAISLEETRYYLNGIYLHSAKSNGADVLRSVATDGHRLAQIEVAQPSGASGMPGVIIPRKTVAEVRKMIEEGGQQVQVSLSDSKIKFVCGEAVLLSKLIDGNFPDYERVIPQGNDKVMEVETSTLSSAVDRVSVIASEKSRGVKFALKGGQLTLSASSAEHGTATEDVDVQYSADEFESGFNARYLLEMLAQIEGDAVQFVLAESTSPALVRDTGDVGALYVIMPMRV